MKSDRTGQVWLRGPNDMSQNSRAVKKFLVLNSARCVTEPDGGFRRFYHPIAIIDPDRIHRFTEWEEHESLDWDEDSDYAFLGLDPTVLP